MAAGFGAAALPRLVVVEAARDTCAHTTSVVGPLEFAPSAAHAPPTVAAGILFNAPRRMRDLADQLRRATDDHGDPSNGAAPATAAAAATTDVSRTDEHAHAQRIDDGDDDDVDAAERDDSGGRREPLSLHELDVLGELEPLDAFVLPVSLALDGDAHSFAEQWAAADESHHDDDAPRAPDVSSPTPTPGASGDADSATDTAASALVGDEIEPPAPQSDRDAARPCVPACAQYHVCAAGSACPEYHSCAGEPNGHAPPRDDAESGVERVRRRLQRKVLARNRCVCAPSGDAAPLAVPPATLGDDDTRPVDELVAFVLDTAAPRSVSTSRNSVPDASADAAATTAAADPCVAEPAEAGPLLAEPAADYAPDAGELTPTELDDAEIALLRARLRFAELAVARPRMVLPARVLASVRDRQRLSAAAAPLVL